jgi:putative porin
MRADSEVMRRPRGGKAAQKMGTTLRLRSGQAVGAVAPARKFVGILRGITVVCIVSATFGAEPQPPTPGTASGDAARTNPGSALPFRTSQITASAAELLGSSIKLAAAKTDEAVHDPDLPASGPAPATAPARKSPNATVNLINRLVERGILPKDDATDLIQQAEQDAADAREQTATARAAAAEAAAARNAVQSNSGLALAPEPVPEPASDDTVRVTYIPEVVKAQMREQIKQEVMDQARAENWAAPRTLPPWAPRFRFMADVRIRYQGDFFPAGNDNTGAFPNFNAINTGAPFDVAGTVFSPQRNVDQTRNRFRLRARLGAEVDLGDSFTMGLRIGTGEDNSPTSQNQTLGVANNAQGGNFSKYAVWLDRGFLKYEAGSEPNKRLSLSLGRFDNPFFGTSVLWYDEIGFDGIALQAKYPITRSITPFITAGAFPVFNTDFNFSSNQPSKFRSEDKFLYAGQLGTGLKITKDLTAKVAGAYYYFDNIEGRLSSPFTPLTSSDQGDTDDLRPSFAQKGNTYMALRNIVPNASNAFGTINQFQYFGLATPFHEIAATARIDYNHFEPVQISVIGEYVKNTAFDRNAINLKAVNNRGPNTALQTVGAFAGGDTAWTVGLKVGSPALQKRWDWNLAASYKYIESDAVVDAFNDPDFGGGGTNLKGYTVGGSLALGSRVWLTLRWFSATAIAGPTFKQDTVQFDVNGSF